MVKRQEWKKPVRFAYFVDRLSSVPNGYL